MRKQLWRRPSPPSSPKSLALLLGAILILSATAPSHLAAQEQPGEDLYLDYDDDVTRSVYANNASAVFGTFVFRVHVPAGAKLSIWLGEDDQGGCYSEGLLFIDGSQVGYTTVGPEPSSWSEPIVATVSSGYAQLAFRAYAACESWVSYPVEKYVRFMVGSPPSEVVVVPPEIEFWADRDRIVRGECTTVHWQTEYVKEVYYQGQGVSGDDQRRECPRQTTTYELYVIVRRTTEQLVDETRYVTIYVEEPPTPTYTPTRPPPTYTPTSRPPTHTPIPTALPATAAPTSRPPTPTPLPVPTAAPAPTAAPRFLVPPEPPKTAPPWLLVVTHSTVLDNEVVAPTPLGAWNTIEGWLMQRYGDNVDVLDLARIAVDRTNWVQVDQAIFDRVQTYTGLPNYILILGGPEVVAFGDVFNPMWDGDIVLTDDVYGDFNGDNLPDVPTARLPDGGDFQLYVEQFSRPGGRTVNGWGSSMVIANVERPYGSAFANLLTTPVQWSAPVNLDDPNHFPGISIANNAYFIVHGSGFDPSRWTGEDPNNATNPTAWNVDWARGAGSQGTIITGACYGAFIGFPRTFKPDGNIQTWPVPVGNSIALTYLRHGAEAFMGHTASHYSYVFTAEVAWCLPWPLDDVCGTRKKIEDWPTTEGAQAIEWFAFQGIASGQPPLDAYHQAKITLFNSLGPPDVYSREEKALHSFVFFGLPPAPTRIEF